MRPSSERTDLDEQADSAKRRQLRPGEPRADGTGSLRRTARSHITRDRRGAILPFLGESRPSGPRHRSWARAQCDHGRTANPSRHLVDAAMGQSIWSAHSFLRNTPRLQCDLHCKTCVYRPAAIKYCYEVHPFPIRIQRCILRGGILCCRVAVHAAVASRDGDSHPSAGRTSLGPAITSTPFAQTSDRRAPPSPRVDACLRPGGTQLDTEGMPRGSDHRRAHAH